MKYILTRVSSSEGVAKDYYYNRDGYQGMDWEGGMDWVSDRDKATVYDSGDIYYAAHTSLKGIKVVITDMDIEIEELVNL